MKNLNKIQAGYYEVGTKIFNFTRSPYFKPLLMLTVVALPFVLSACAEGANQIQQLATATPHVDPTNAHPLLTPEVSATSQASFSFADLGKKICSIVDFHSLGASDGLGNNYPAAIPEGGQLTLDCNGDQQLWNVGYSELAHDTTSFVHGPVNGVHSNLTDLTSLERMGEIHPQVFEVPKDPLLNNCPIDAAPASGLQGATNNLDLTSDDFLAMPATTVGNTSSIFIEDHNGGVASLPLDFPEYLQGAGGNLYDHGFLNWAIFHKAGERLMEFVGFVRPNNQCPMYIEK
jgi:hypothetical protein